ncbi:MAG: 4Fe-4S dicluster domain-containing protein [Thermoanaerobaculia bacterium]
MTEPERETLEMDVVFVGAGPASLAGAYHLARLIEEHNEAGHGEPIEAEIAVLEKGQEVGSHGFSGAVVDPVAFRELAPDRWEEAPFEAPVGKDRLLWLTEKRALGLPTPPQMSNHGYSVASLGKLVKWLADLAEEKGVSVFPGFPASKVLMEGGSVVGVRTVDQGLDRNGEKKANYQPGMDLRTRCTVLGEGVRGTLVKQLDGHLDLWAGKNPMTYAIGLKEHWELPEGRLAPGEVIHTMNWPLGSEVFGGGFLYGFQDGLAAVGLVVGLDYENPWTDPHDEFQRFKTHPAIARLLEGGKMVNYGAKAIPEGGWYAVPRLAGEGFLIIGDSGGFLNPQKLKGISLGMKSGMLAAETIFEALKADRFDAAAFEAYPRKVESSWLKRDLWKVRNFHQGFDKGLVGGIAQGALGTLTGGRGWGVKQRLTTEPGHERMRRLDRPEGKGMEPRPNPEHDGELTFDRLADVYNSGTSHEEDQPVHLLVHDTEICVTRCTVEYGNPCERFCPAAVYEMVEDPAAEHGRRLQINASNCVHCKTCDIMDPYQIITWVPPEGGGGPNYGRM